VKEKAWLRLPEFCPQDGIEARSRRHRDTRARNFATNRETPMSSPSSEDGPAGSPRIGSESQGPIDWQAQDWVTASPTDPAPEGQPNVRGNLVRACTQPWHAGEEMNHASRQTPNLYVGEPRPDALSRIAVWRRHARASLSHINSRRSHQKPDSALRLPTSYAPALSPAPSPSPALWQLQLCSARNAGALATSTHEVPADTSIPDLLVSLMPMVPV
jgi:hypothetical protein